MGTALCRADLCQLPTATARCAARSPDAVSYPTWRRETDMTRRGTMTTVAVALATGLAIGTVAAQQRTGGAPPATGAPQGAPAGPVPYFVGNRLGMPINPAPDGAF